MEAFERSYNQFSVNNYRETLAGICEGKVSFSRVVGAGDLCRVE